MERFKGELPNPESDPQEQEQRFNAARSELLHLLKALTEDESNPDMTKEEREIDVTLPDGRQVHVYFPKFRPRAERTTAKNWGSALISERLPKTDQTRHTYYAYLPDGVSKGVVHLPSSLSHEAAFQELRRILEELVPTRTRLTVAQIAVNEIEDLVETLKQVKARQWLNHGN